MKNMPLSYTHPVEWDRVDEGGIFVGQEIIGGVVVMSFEQDYEQWLQGQIEEESNPRRRELLKKGLGHGTVELLRTIWYPAIGNFDHLYAEWEVRDFNNSYRYLDLAYIPGNAKGNIEIHGFKSHARDLDVTRFKDLCRRQSLLTLDDWLYLPIAYLSIRDKPELCKQLILSFVGKFMSMDVQPELSWLEAETVRLSRRLLRPFTPLELAAHLRITDRHARRILHRLTEQHILHVAGGQQRYRTFQYAWR